MAKYEALFSILEEVKTGKLAIQFELDYGDAAEVKKETITRPLTKELARDLIRYFEGAAKKVDEESKGDVEYQKDLIARYLEILKKFLEK